MARIYKETKVDVRPVAPNTVVNIQIPTQDQQRRARFSISSSPAQEEPIAKDEDEFARRYLATQGSIYFRQRKVYPRTFLWRVVDDNRVLEIQSADLTRSVTEPHDANIMLRLDFQEEIIPSGVALADLEDHEALNVFVLTTSKQLYTLTLRPEFFRRAASIDENVSDWCKTCTPAPLAFSYPHRLHASSPLELFIGLDSGALLRLTRRAGDDGSHWSPITFDEKTWGASIRGLVRWSAQPTIQYGGRNLDPTTATAIATTSDQTYVFVVCLNHTLKIWNLASNKLVGSKDLLDRPIQQQNALSFTLNPAETAFIRVFNAERALDGGYRYYVATYSPYEDGRFKFWAVRGGLTMPLTIEDLFPDATLKPLDPDPSGNTFWSVADFQIKSMEEGRRMELWILWRNNNMYHLCTLHFDFPSLVEDWSRNWVSTALETRRYEPPPPIVSGDVVDPTEKWLKYLFHPGRYSPEVLETALATYQEALRPRAVAGGFKKGSPLQERICSVVGSTVSLRKYSEDDMDYTRYRTDTDTKWRQFWQIADDINKRRLEPISLAYDTYTDMPWVLLTDACVVVRECSSTELLLHNSGAELRSNFAKIEDRWRHRNIESELGDRYEQAPYLIEAAAGFRKKFPADLERACQTALQAEIFTEPSLSVPDRMAAFQERCELGERISDEAFDSLCASINEHLNVNDLPSELFYAILDTAPLGFPGKDSELLPTMFGLRVTVNGAQETILHTRQILFDLLILVVFLESEINQEEGSTFNAVELFATLVDMLREYEMMSWLSSTVRKCPDKFRDDNVDTSVSTFSLKARESKSKEGRTTTILEDLFAIHIKPRPAVGIPRTYTLMQGIRDVLSWVTRQGEVAYPNVLVFIQCDLIANGNIDLASDFLRFQPNTAWATYAKGRLYVAKSEFDVAAIYFQKAAHLLASGRALGNLHEMSSNLLDILSVDNFNNGLPKYYQHIVSVFEQARSFSHVADFASLALQALETDQSYGHNPEYAALRTDLLSRLFHASLKTRQFDKAYSAISRYTDLALQKSALSSLITNVLAASGPGTAGLKQLLHFPVSLAPNFSSYVDEILVSLAKKQTSFSSFLETENNEWSKSNNTPDYHRILHAYRIARNDFRGAAEVAYQTVQRLRRARDAPSYSLVFHKGRDNDESKRVVEEDDPESKEIRYELLALINLLACVDKSEAYILVEEEAPSNAQADRRQSVQTDEDGNVFMDDVSTGSPSLPNRRGSSSAGVGGGLSFAASRRDSKSSVGGGVINGFSQQQQQPSKPPRRVIVTLEHLRREYQAELDRVSRIERGDWEFGAVDGEPDDGVVDNEDTMVLS